MVEGAMTLDLAIKEVNNILRRRPLIETRSKTYNTVNKQLANQVLYKTVKKDSKDKLGDKHQYCGSLLEKQAVQKKLVKTHETS